MSQSIKEIFQQTDKGAATIIVPAPTLFEIAYLNQKGRFHISLEKLDWLLHNSLGYQEYLLDFNIIKTSFEITDIPELHDRLIAGTARYLDVPILTNDPLIIASQFVKTI